MFGTGLLAPWLKRAREFRQQHRRIAYLTTEIETLRKDIDQLSRLVNFDRRIDLVLFGGMPVFMYQGDLAYRQAPRAPKMTDDVFDTTSFLDRIAVPEKSVHEGSAVGMCVDHLLQHFDDIAVLDVGCSYGAFALHLAYLLQRRGRHEPVYAFDAGTAGNLVALTIEANRAMGQVQFFPYAVGDRCGMTLFFSDTGNSENDRLGNCVAETTRSRPVPMTTVDQFMREHGGMRPAFIKIDTQGFDPEVIDGASETLAQPVIAMVEFTPDAIQRRRSPAAFIRTLVERCIVLDMMHPGRGPIAVEEAEAFAEAVDKTDMHWTDIICISRSVPDQDRLLEQLKSRPASIVA